VLDYREFGADSSAPAPAPGRGHASLVLLAAPPAAAIAPSLRVVVHEAILEAPAILDAARDPGPPVPLLPPVPARDARRIRDLLASRGVTVEVVRAGTWRRAILAAGSSPVEIAAVVTRAESFAAAAGVPPAELPGLVAVLREAAANAAQHGNRGEAARRVRVDMVVSDGSLALAIEDEGPGFDHEAVARALERGKGAVELAEERAAAGGRGGLGLLMMRRWAEKLAWEAGGRRIRLERRFGT
jgi:anti-sigma regulatory factor (Ser/Thr protein kinase)